MTPLGGKSHKGTYSVTGYPAFFLCVMPMIIGWAWIIATLLRAVLKGRAT